MEKTKKNRIKKFILAALAVATVATITASMTFAYLTDKTDTVSNMFTGSDNVTAVLYEPNWDGSSATTPSGVGDSDLTDEMGKKIAKSYKVGNAIPKNPMIANTSETDEYVAIKLVYKVKLKETDADYTEVTKDEFDRLATITGWASDWTDASDNVYVYNNILAKKNSGIVQSTSALFESVTVNSTLIPGQAFELSTGGSGKTIQLTETYSMPEFEIEVKGAVVDTADFDSATAATATLKTLFA